MTIMSLDGKIWEDGQCGKAESQETCQLWYGKETKRFFIPGHEV